MIAEDPAGPLDEETIQEIAASVGGYARWRAAFLADGGVPLSVISTRLCLPIPVLLQILSEELDGN
jgi:hypothetical protein